MKRASQIFLYAFAVVGFLDLGGRVILFPFTGMLFGYVAGLPVDFKAPEVVFSGDHSLKAIIYVWSGPTFDAGCDKMVAIVDAAAPVQTSWKSDNLVFRAGCDEFFHIQWDSPADGRVRPRLRIEANAGKGDFMSRSAMNGRVAVAYQGDH